jgi:hypothetical protein
MQNNELDIPPHIVNKLAAQLIETYRFSDTTCAALKADNDQMRTIFSMYKVAFDINIKDEPGKAELLTHMLSASVRFSRASKPWPCLSRSCSANLSSSRKK